LSESDEGESVYSEREELVLEGVSTGGRSLLAVFAHPDDETFATGATLARYASEGVHIVLYCATDGEAGKTSGLPVSSPSQLGRLRRKELHAACEILGVGYIEHGSHADGKLAAADPYNVIGEIVSLIRGWQPDVVITFGPEGAPTQHPDHCAISRLATAAFFLAGTNAYAQQLSSDLQPHRATRLCYVTWPTPEPESRYQIEGQPIHLSIDARPWNGKKMEAYEAHRSQHQHRANFEEYAMVERECYHVAAGLPLGDGATDLFRGAE
jgi:LmbE family N-acetylglucosaminyl deacetylase